MDEKRAEYLVERYADLLVRIGYTRTAASVR